MKVSEFQFELPDELIAQHPLEKRTDSRLLCMDAVTGQLTHHQFKGFLDLVNPGDLLVFNNTRVIPYSFIRTKNGYEMSFEKPLENCVQIFVILCRSVFFINMSHTSKYSI